MKATRCPSCVHLLYQVPLGPCQYVVEGLRAKGPGKAVKAVCGCRHVSHFTEHVGVMDE